MKSLLFHSLNQHNETLGIKTLSQLAANTLRGTAERWEQPLSAAVSLQTCWRPGQPVRDANFTSHSTAKVICFPTNSGKQVTTSEGLGDSNRNMAGDFPSTFSSAEELLTQNTEAELWSVALKESQALPYLPSQTGPEASPFSEKAWLSCLSKSFRLQLRPPQKDQK